MVDFTSPRTLSDQEIIQRAKGLGLVEMKDVYKDSVEKDETAPKDTQKDTTKEAPKETPTEKKN
jgi:hypothetical protein